MNALYAAILMATIAACTIHADDEAQAELYDPWHEHLIFVMPGEEINQGVMK